MGVIRRYLVWGALFGLVLALGRGSSAQEQVTVTLPPLVLTVGESGELAGLLECEVGGCSAFAITIRFDPDDLRIDSAEVGPCLGDQVMVVESEIDPDTGTVRLAAVVLGEPPETGANLLFRLRVTALAPGITLLQITELQVGDAVGNSLLVAGVDGLVVVGGGAQPEVTAVPEATPLLEVTPEATLSLEVGPLCTVSTAETEIFVHVGPGHHRGIRGLLPVDTDIPVIGWAVDDEGNLWWKILPSDYEEAEADRYWVAQEDVTWRGDCDQVEAAEESVLVPFSTASPVTVGQPGNTAYVAVFDCTYLGNNVFEWYEAEVVCDEDGQTTAANIVGGPHTGGWQEGCPAGETAAPTPAATRERCQWVQAGTCCIATLVCEIWQNTCTSQQELRNCAPSCMGNTCPSI